VDTLRSRDDGRGHERGVRAREKAIEDGDDDETAGGTSPENSETDDAGAGAHDGEKVQGAKVVRKEVGGDTAKDRGGVEDGEGVEDDI
jgi:hypothetical protein